MDEKHDATQMTRRDSSKALCRQEQELQEYQHALEESLKIIAGGQPEQVAALKAEIAQVKKELLAFEDPARALEVHNKNIGEAIEFDMMCYSEAVQVRESQMPTPRSDPT